MQSSHQVSRKLCKIDIIPRFLKFRIPNNGCFDDQSVHDFQRRLLRKELFSAKRDFEDCIVKLDEKRSLLRSLLQFDLIPSVVLYIRIARKDHRRKQEQVHSKKL